MRRCVLILACARLSSATFPPEAPKATAPGGVGTYPAGITAGAIALGASSERLALAALAQASVNAHLLIIVSALTGTAISLPLGRRGKL